VDLCRDVSDIDRAFYEAPHDTTIDDFSGLSYRHRRIKLSFSSSERADLDDQSKYPDSD